MGAVLKHLLPSTRKQLVSFGLSETELLRQLLFESRNPSFTSRRKTENRKHQSLIVGDRHAPDLEHGHVDATCSLFGSGAVTGSGST